MRGHGEPEKVFHCVFQLFFANDVGAASHLSLLSGRRKLTKVVFSDKPEVVGGTPDITKCVWLVTFYWCWSGQEPKDQGSGTRAQGSRLRPST